MAFVVDTLVSAVLGFFGFWGMAFYISRYHDVTGFVDKMIVLNGACAFLLTWTLRVLRRYRPWQRQASYALTWSTWALALTQVPVAILTPVLILVYHGATVVPALWVYPEQAVVFLVEVFVQLNRPARASLGAIVFALEWIIPLVAGWWYGARRRE